MLIKEHCTSKREGCMKNLAEGMLSAFQKKEGFVCISPDLN
jgi:hypothetical protein